MSFNTPFGDESGTRRANVMGVVYLLHFDRKFAHAQHYLGWTEDLEKRFLKHIDGQGARIVSAAASSGINAELVRTWLGTRKLERRLKNWKKARQLCPECRGVEAETMRAGANLVEPTA